MDEDSFTKRFPARFLYLMFTSTLLLAFFAFTLPGRGGYQNEMDVSHGGMKPVQKSCTVRQSCI